MKKIFISFCCVLILYNFTLNTFASVVPSDYEIQNEFDESIVLPVVYDNASTYSFGGTIALGSLGLTTAEGVAILGGLASTVAPILGAVALVGGALVVGQGLVNIYDYITDYALTKEEAESLGTSVSLESDGRVKLTLVKKNPNNGKPEIPEPNSEVVRDIGFSFISHSNIKGSDKTNLNNYFLYNSKIHKNTLISGRNYVFKPVDPNNYYFHYSYSSSSNKSYYTFYDSFFATIDNTYKQARIGGYGKSIKGVFDHSTGSFTWSTGETTSYNTGGSWYTGTPFDLDSMLANEYYKLTLVPYSYIESLRNSSSYTLQHSQQEFHVDKEVIENLNPDLEFNGSEYVDKNLGTVVNPDNLIIPMPDISTENGFEFSPDVDNVIRPEKDPIPTPEPSPEPSPDDGTWLDQVKEFFKNFWDWLCNFWQNLLDLLMYLFNLFFGGLLDLLGLIVDTVTNILNFLYELPSHFLNLFQELFVPSSDFFSSKFENILTGLTNKVPLFGQIKDFFTNLNLGGEGTPPKITITLPEFFGGETYDFIDFRFFEQYRSYYLNIVRVFMWIFALKHIYRRLPSVISGGGYL